MLKVQEYIDYVSTFSGKLLGDHSEFEPNSPLTSRIYR